MKNWNISVKIARIVFLLFGVITIVRLRVRIGDLEDSVAAARDEVESLSAQIEELTEEVEEPIDDEYIRKIAREILGYHLPSEIVFYNDTAR